MLNSFKIYRVDVWHVYDKTKTPTPKLSSIRKKMLCTYYEKRFDANAKKFMHWKNSAQRQFSTTAGIVTH